MSTVVWTRRGDGPWEISEAPQRIELDLPTIVAADPHFIHAEGRRLVLSGADGHTVWYLPTGYDTTAGVMHLTKDREDGPLVIQGTAHLQAVAHDGTTEDHTSEEALGSDRPGAS